MNYCYMLYTDKNQTYIGATIDPDRRLRQHNKEISGGASIDCREFKGKNLKFLRDLLRKTLNHGS